MCVRACMLVPAEAGGVRSPEARITGSYQSPTVGIGNQTQDLCTAVCFPNF